MSVSASIVADGSSPADAHELVFIRASEARDRWRYRCANNHTRWEGRGEYLICHSCAEMHDVDPIYRELYDAKREETIPWSSVVIEE